MLLQAGPQVTNPRLPTDLRTTALPQFDGKLHYISWGPIFSDPSLGYLGSGLWASVRTEQLCVKAHTRKQEALTSRHQLFCSPTSQTFSRNQRKFYISLYICVYIHTYTYPLCSLGFVALGPWKSGLTFLSNIISLLHVCSKILWDLAGLFQI